MPRIISNYNASVKNSNYVLCSPGSAILDSRQTYHNPVGGFVPVLRRLMRTCRALIRPFASAFMGLIYFFMLVKNKISSLKTGGKRVSYAKVSTKNAISSDKYETKYAAPDTSIRTSVTKARRTGSVMVRGFEGYVMADSVPSVNLKSAVKSSTKVVSRTKSFRIFSSVSASLSVGITLFSILTFVAAQERGYLGAVGGELFAVAAAIFLIQRLVSYLCK